ncbi:MAG: exo-beta-N-acetylmuramidase NamZ family protein [Treponema sp.]
MKKFSVFFVVLLSIAFLYGKNKEDVIKLGIDRIDEYLNFFEGKRVALITNMTGYNSEGKSTISILKEKTNLRLLFSPEHGLNANFREGALIDNAIDRKTSLKIYSLYGKQKKPTKEMLEDIDVVCFDIQDVGSRFYTYIYTMAYAMQACAENKKTFVVFDRPNPICGNVVEGFILQEEFKSFVGLYPIAQRHGMTVGELSFMFNKEFGINCNLKIVPLKNWSRFSYFEDLPLIWIPTSPNIPNASTALIYSGMCLFEGTNLSVGRGTTLPFHYIGAPFINADELVEKVNKENLKGVKFFPAYFTPNSSIYKDEACEGLYIAISDKNVFQPVRVAIKMFNIIKKTYPKFKINDDRMRRCGLNLLFGNASLSEKDIDEKLLFKAMSLDEREFIKKRQAYLLY